MNRLTLISALALMVASIVGATINANWLLGDYEWAGLLRIFRELMARDGFWCIALLLYFAGLRTKQPKLPPLSKIRSLSVAQNLRFNALSAAVLACIGLASATTLRLVGTHPDLLAAYLLMLCMIFQALEGHQTPHQRVNGLLKAIVSALLVFGAYTLVCYFHTMVKGLLFILAEPADGWMWRLDTRLLGANHYQVLQAWRLAHPSWVQWLDIVYVGLMQQMSWAVFFFYAANNWVAGRRYLLAMFSIYLIGPLFYFPVPSEGPLFYAPHLFADIQSAAPDTWQLSRFLIYMTSAASAGFTTEIAPFCYIAAMPSLHVGLAVILLLSMRRSLIASLLNLILLAMTIVATNVLGWHYLSDAIIGGLLGVVCWYGAVTFDQHFRADLPKAGNMPKPE